MPAPPPRRAARRAGSSRARPAGPARAAPPPRRAAARQARRSPHRSQAEPTAHAWLTPSPQPSGSGRSGMWADPVQLRRAPRGRRPGTPDWRGCCPIASGWLASH
eukprot:scaffold67311_cov60-Phaeocystis_antarctica.AAC.5